MKGNGLFLLSGILVLTSRCASTLPKSGLMWVWKCDSAEEACTRVSNDSTEGDDALYPSLEICRLVCGQYGGLWPRPTVKTEISNVLFSFALRSVNIVYPNDDNDVDTFLQEASGLFLKSISYEEAALCAELQNTVTVSFNIATAATDLNWDTNESYSLTIATNNNVANVQINALTIFGARHALETLSQLIEIYPINNGSTCLATVQAVKIYDKPIYRHRGLLLDSARNFLSVGSVKKHLDGMAYSKLNVLHWHITDSQSFPLELPSLPNMTKYGAYSEDKIYHPDDVTELLAYAKLRGIRIIIEIDAPSHSGNGWQWGESAGLGNLAVCIDQQPWRSYCIQPPCGQLNPINPNLYEVLKKLYSDINNMLPKGEIFHMGGDEVYIPCWNSTPEIIKYLGNKARTTDTFLDLWSEYQTKALEAYDSVVGNTNTPIVLWSSHLTQVDVIEKYLPKERYIIQTWVPSTDPLPANLLSLGYRIIVSTKNTWYLDHGFWGGTAYHNWRSVYANKIPSNNNTIGGEVCMWGEYVDDSSIEPKVWPRAAAAAERLWTNPRTTVVQAERRFYRHRERLVSRGISADAVIPKWCAQNEGECG